MEQVLKTYCIFKVGIRNVLLLLILSVMMEGLNGDLWLYLVYVRDGEGEEWEWEWGGMKI